MSTTVQEVVKIEKEKERSEETLVNDWSYDESTAFCMGMVGQRWHTVGGEVVTKR